ncbi:MAG: hypothetical protein WCY14_08820, partial [Arcobacteraceae bacterium]
GKGTSCNSKGCPILVRRTAFIKHLSQLCVMIRSSHTDHIILLDHFKQQCPSANDEGHCCLNNN